MISRFQSLQLSLSPTHLVAFVLTLSFIAILLKIVHRLAYSPIRSIPGPWYAAISDFWLTTHVIRLRQCFIVEKLFKEYGPVVRIGPNKVAFCNHHAMRNVYCIQKFDKSCGYSLD
jgi:hypothetical protein